MNVCIYGYYSQDTSTNHKFQIIGKNSSDNGSFLLNYYIDNSYYISFMVFYQ